MKKRSLCFVMLWMLGAGHAYASCASADACESDAVLAPHAEAVIYGPFSSSDARVLYTFIFRDFSVSRQNVIRHVIESWDGHAWIAESDSMSEGSHVVTRNVVSEGKAKYRYRILNEGTESIERWTLSRRVTP
ncbi:MAG: hypothetical protein ABN482_05940 [Corticimicrobacter sp.]|uniref:hypothetical protein n=1 Tax=Corticimicrobacter sp. TaxID=2678536 RepID=UPI0032D9B436